MNVYSYNSILLYARNCILLKILVEMLFTKFNVQILPVVLHKGKGVPAQ